MLQDGLSSAFLLVHLFILLGSEANVLLGIALHAVCDRLCSATEEMVDTKSVREVLTSAVPCLGGRISICSVTLLSPLQGIPFPYTKASQKS